MSFEEWMLKQSIKEKLKARPAVKDPPPGRTVKCMNCRELIRTPDGICPICHHDLTNHPTWSILT